PWRCLPRFSPGAPPRTLPSRGHGRRAMAVFDKAKQLKEQAAQRAAEIKDQAAQRAAEVKENVSSAASEVKDGVTQVAAEAKTTVAQAAVDAKDASVAKLRETIDHFNAALPVIRQAGYAVTGVDVGVGIPPRVSASVDASDEVTAEHVEAVLAE